MRNVKARARICQHGKHLQMGERGVLGVLEGDRGVLESDRVCW